MTDQLGYRGRIAIVVPSTNTSCQPECETLRPRGVTNHTGRISIKAYCRKKKFPSHQFLGRP